MNLTIALRRNSTTVSRQSPAAKKCVPDTWMAVRLIMRTCSESAIPSILRHSRLPLISIGFKYAVAWYSAPACGREHRPRIDLSRFDEAKIVRHFRCSYRMILTSSAASIGMSCNHVSLRTEACDQLLIAVDFFLLWSRRCNQPLASGICLACQAQRGSGCRNPLLPC
jgi:hypothetical protein